MGRCCGDVAVVVTADALVRAVAVAAVGGAVGGGYAAAARTSCSSCHHRTGLLRAAP